MRKNYPLIPSITFINYFEFVLGLEDKSESERIHDMGFINSFHFLNTTKHTARILARLKYKYHKKGKPLPLVDLMIASQVIENNMILITKDKHFLSIEELTKMVID